MSNKRNTRNFCSLRGCEPLEKRELLAAHVYEPGFDPIVGAAVTSFFDRSESDFILDGFKTAIDELVDTGVDEVSLALIRQLDDDGNFFEGISMDHFRRAAEYAVQKELTLGVKLIFEVESVGGWRGDYNPTGTERTTFRQEYRDLILDLAEIPGVSRLQVGTEMDTMVADLNNLSYFQSLITDVRATGFDGKLGLTASQDGYLELGYEQLWLHPEVDFLGINPYFSIFDGFPFYGGGLDQNELDWIEGIEPDTDGSLLQEMTDRWNVQLDEIEGLAARIAGDKGAGLPIFIEEFGAIPSNYASTFPASTDPGGSLARAADVPISALENPQAFDRHEQAALFESLLTALDGRGDTFETVVFWTWEHQAAPRTRSLPNQSYDALPDKFSIWPYDDGGGEVVAEFLRKTDLTLEGDFTGDGKTDIATYDAESGELRVSVSTNSGFAPDVYWGNITSTVDWRSVVVGDYTGDGKDDIAVLAKTTGTWWLIESMDDDRFQNQYLNDNSWDSSAHWVDVQAGDFNGDGKDDIVGRDETSGRWRVALTTLQGTTDYRFQSCYWGAWNYLTPGADPDFLWNQRMVWSNIQVGDFDNDGKDDIAGQAQRDGSWWVGTAEAGWFHTRNWATWSASVDWVNVMTGDFNGDGYDDIVGRDAQSGHWRVAASWNVNNQRKFVHWNWGQWGTQVDWKNVRVGDFDNDGDDDIVGQNAGTGQLWVSLASVHPVTGTVATFWNSLWAENAPVENSEAFLGDFNGDGRDDLLLKTANNDWVLEQSVVTGFWRRDW